MKLILLFFFAVFRNFPFTFKSCSALTKNLCIFLDEVSATLLSMFSAYIFVVTSPPVCLAVILKLCLLNDVLRLKYEKSPELDVVIFGLIIPDSMKFCGTLQSTFNLICKKTLWKEDELVS